MSQDPLVIVHIKAPHGARTTEIGWSDGARSVYPNDLLRGYCPCARCQGHGGHIGFVPGGNSDLREIEPVGNYALQLTWGDGHDTGIYTFRYLRELSARPGVEHSEPNGPEPPAAMGEAGA